MAYSAVLRPGGLHPGLWLAMSFLLQLAISVWLAWGVGFLVGRLGVRDGLADVVLLVASVSIYFLVGHVV